jgi:hypothetical protein
VPLVRRLALLLALEGLLLIGLGVAYGVAGLSQSSQELATELAAGLAVLTGVVLLAVARGTDRGRGWARSPAVVVNVFPFPIGLGMLDAGLWWVAVPMVVLAGSVLYLFATPALRLVFRERS